MDLRLIAKNVYGRRRLYPGCEKSMVFAKIIGCKSIPESQIKNLEEMGFGIKLEGWSGGKSEPLSIPSQQFGAFELAC